MQHQTSNNSNKNNMHKPNKGAQAKSALELAIDRFLEAYRDLKIIQQRDSQFLGTISAFNTSHLGQLFHHEVIEWPPSANQLATAEEKARTLKCGELWSELMEIWNSM